MASRIYEDPSAFDIQTALSELMQVVQLNPADTGGSISFSGQDPILPSKHRLGAIMSLGMMGASAATQILYRMRGGDAQDLSVDLRTAVAHINPLVAYKPKLSGLGYQLLFGDPRINPMSFGIYPTKDGRWYLPTAAYPMSIPPWMELLKCDLNGKAVGNAISQWNALDLEDAAAAKGMIGSMCRTPEEWLNHPQGKLLSQTPLIEIFKIGDSEPELPPLLDKMRPLSGLKVINNTHVIAGQVVGRTLAEQGAQVLHFARPEYEYDALWVDTAPGMRSAWMDLTQPATKVKAAELLKSADVFVENYRGRKLAELGFSAEAVAAIRPGIIYTSIRAFGWDGPWSQRAGFDMDANCCTGFTVDEGTEDAPKLPCTVVLNDYLAGYLTAMGTLAALILRAKFGGSYHVRTSLARFSMWYATLGILDPNYVAETLKDSSHKVIPPKGLQGMHALGEVDRLEPGITFSKTPGRWELPGGLIGVARGGSKPEWGNY
ncbi:CoA transferase [Granulicella arctica]|uniref:CoA transferase n=1 Tax=Granulicella arctica TaxID=940613 RepID=UPI0021DFFCB9|nr:CoA transferase [Granulicella arctica]